jgi:hypothetical protein
MTPSPCACRHPLIRCGVRCLPALLLLVSGACATGAPGASAALRAGEALGPRTRVAVVAEPAGEAPLDGPALVRLRLVAPGAARQLEGTFVGGVAFDDAAAVLTTERRLVRFDLEGEPAPLAEDVAFVPVVSLDGAHLAYATLEAGALHVLDALGDRTVAADLGSIGALAFSPDGARVAFVGARRGGIAGVWLADARGLGPARCLTNCALETGGPLDGRVPLPAQPIAFDGSALTWMDDAGGAHRVEVGP